MFDPDWAAHGHLDTVVRRAADWITARRVPGLTLEIVQLADATGRRRTPVLFFEVAATRPAETVGVDRQPTVLLYGHLDKQPEFSGWRSDLGPWTPKLRRRPALTAAAAPTTATRSMPRIAAIEALKAQGAAAPAHRRPDRDRRGERLRRPAVLRRGAACAAGRRQPGGLPRLRRRQLRAALADHLAARAGQRRAEGRGTRPRASIRATRQRRGAVELPHPAPPARPAGGQRHRAAAARAPSMSRSRRLRLEQARATAAVLGDRRSGRR